MSYYLPVACYLVVILVFSSQTSGSPVLNNFPIPFALGHFIGYGGLAVIVYRAINKGINSWDEGKAGYTLLFCTAYAVFDEFYQSFVPSRTSTINDVIVNGLGSLFALLLIRTYVLHVRDKTRV